jgi:hypothetical protein
MRYQKTLLSFDVNVYTASPRAYLSTQGTKKQAVVCCGALKSRGSKRLSVEIYV